MTPQSELLETALRGDRESLGMLLEQHRPRLYASALRLYGCGADAHDAVQETFLIALTKIDSLRNADSFGAWMNRVMRNLFLMSRRSPRRCSPLSDHLLEGMLEQRFESVALRGPLSDAVSSLPESLRITVMLRYFSTFDSYQDIATILQIPVGTVRSRLSEAHKKVTAAIAMPMRDAEGMVKRSRARAILYKESFEELYKGKRNQFLSAFAQDLIFVYSSGMVVQGRHAIEKEANDDLTTGSRFYPEAVAGDEEVSILEGPMESPPDRPFYCPPAGCLVLFHKGAKISRAHLHHAQRLPHTI
jgi:RNA polymerase sigma-70 factor (ECF subfamily)